MKKIWTPEMEEVLRKDYSEQGAGWCAHRLGMSSRQVMKRANVLGLRVSADRMKQKQSDNAKKMWIRHPEGFSGVNSRIFSDCRTKEAAYVLGLLWADGCVGGGRENRIAIELVEKDFDVVWDVFKATGKWGVFRRQRKGRKPQAGAVVSSKLLAEFLRLCGYGNKHVSSACVILERLPDELRRYWWRGFFDGDGCFHSRRYVRIRRNKEYREHVAQMSLAGGFCQDWTFASQLFRGLGVRFKVQRRPQRKGKKKSTSSYVRVTSKDGIRRFGEYLYGDYDGIGLRRKYDAWLRCLATRYDTGPECDKD